MSRQRVLFCACFLTALVAACGTESSAEHTNRSRVASTTPVTAKSTTTTAAVASLPILEAVEPTGTKVACSSATADAPVLGQAQTHLSFNLLSPFGVAFSPDGSRLFVSEAVNPPRQQPPIENDYSAIMELSVSASTLTATRVDTLPREQEFLGEAESPNGRYLVAASGSGADVFSISRIEDPDDPPSSTLLGQLTSAGGGAIEAIVSPNNEYVFVSLENSHSIAVFNLASALENGFDQSDLVGYIPTGLAPVGLAISPDGRYLFATSEANSQTTAGGTLTTVDLAEAESDPAHSIVSTVWAGCSPVRVIVDSSAVYVTARGSDQLLEFSEQALTAGRAGSLIDQVVVGEAPVGLALVDHDQKIVVGDSDRFNAEGVSSSLAVVDVGLKGALSLAGYLPAGGFPRDMAVSPDGSELIVVNFASGQLEEVDVGSL